MSAEAEKLKHMYTAENLKIEILSYPLNHFHEEFLVYKPFTPEELDIPQAMEVRPDLKNTCNRCSFSPIEYSWQKCSTVGAEFLQ